MTKSKDGHEWKTNTNPAMLFRVAYLSLTWIGHRHVSSLFSFVAISYMMSTSIVKFINPTEYQARTVCVVGSVLPALSNCHRVNHNRFANIHNACLISTVRRNHVLSTRYNQSGAYGGNIRTLTCYHQPKYMKWAKIMNGYGIIEADMIEVDWTHDTVPGFVFPISFRRFFRSFERFRISLRWIHFVRWSNYSLRWAFFTEIPEKSVWVQGLFITLWAFGQFYLVFPVSFPPFSVFSGVPSYPGPSSLSSVPFSALCAR